MTVDQAVAALLEAVRAEAERTDPQVSATAWSSLPRHIQDRWAVRLAEHAVRHRGYQQQRRADE